MLDDGHRTTIVCTHTSYVHIHQRYIYTSDTARKRIYVPRIIYYTSYKACKRASIGASGCVPTMMRISDAYPPSYAVFSTRYDWMAWTATMHRCQKEIVNDEAYESHLTSACRSHPSLER